MIFHVLIRVYADKMMNPARASAVSIHVLVILDICLYLLC